MPRSHPPTLIRLVGRCLERECGVVPGDVLLAAVSGGPDSMALLHVLSILAPRMGFGVFACGVDHGLRPEAAAELSLAEQAAAQWGVPFERRSVCVAPGGNLQARARDARYAALRERARAVDAKYLVVGHHQDDRAETVLLRLLRGAGPRGLAVLPPRAGDVLRPMIRASRRDVTLHLQRHGVPSSQDPSNHDPRFLRSRVRHELLPLLRELSPGITEHLAAVADQLQIAGAPAASGSAEMAACAAPFDASVDGVPLNREQARQLRQVLSRATASSEGAAATGRARGDARQLHVPLSRERALVLDSRTGRPTITPPTRIPAPLRLADGARPSSPSGPSGDGGDVNSPR